MSIVSREPYIREASVGPVKIPGPSVIEFQLVGPHGTLLQDVFEQSYYQKIHHTLSARLGPLPRLLVGDAAAVCFWNIQPPAGNKPSFSFSFALQPRSPQPNLTFLDKQGARGAAAPRTPLTRCNSPCYIKSLCWVYFPLFASFLVLHFVLLVIPQFFKIR